MATPKLKLGNDKWATKQRSLLAYNDEGNNFKSLPFQVERLSGGSYVGRNGLIQYAATEEPRIDFTNYSKGALLLEPQRTNQFTKSENLANIDFQTNSTITTDNIISPNGSLTADKTTQTTGGYLRETVSVSNGTTYSFSVFLKKGDLRYAVIRSLFSQNGTTPANSNNVFDLDNGSVIYTGTDVVSASIEAYANDWYRCSFVSLASSTGSAPFIDFYFTSSSSSTQSSGAAGFGYGWGMQLEAGDYSTSYIPTADSTATRVKDEVYNGGNQYIFNLTEGTFFIDVNPFIPSANTNIGISNGTDSQKIVFIFQSYGTQVRTFSSGGVSEFDNLTFNQRNKIAVSFKTNEYKIFINGTKVGTDTSASVPTGMDRLNFSNRTNTASYFEGEIYQTQIYNEVLTEAELTTLTTL